MKAILAVACLTLAACAGCVNLSDSKVKEIEVRAELKTTAPVTADQVNAQNAYLISQSLAEEIDHDQRTDGSANRAAAKSRK